MAAHALRVRVCITVDQRRDKTIPKRSQLKSDLVKLNQKLGATNVALRQLHACGISQLKQLISAPDGTLAPHVTLPYRDKVNGRSHAVLMDVIRE
eukprot:2546429-Rhodomonas_salina.1